MKRQGLFALTLSIMLILSACGTPSSNTPSNNTPASGNSVTDDFLKTITAETAEAKGVCGADLTWYYQDGVLVIKGTGEMNDYPYSLGGFLPSSQITKAPWGKESEGNLYQKIHWLIVDEGVTSIGGASFNNCSELSKVILPSTLESIGKFAFEECFQLSEITIPDSVSYIGEKAFNGCSSLSDITIPSSVTYMGNYIFSYCDLNSITFLGDAPENIYMALLLDEGGTRFFDGTLNYSGSGFTEEEMLASKRADEDQLVSQK